MKTNKLILLSLFGLVMNLKSAHHEACFIATKMILEKIKKEHGMLGACAEHDFYKGIAEPGRVVTDARVKALLGKYKLIDETGRVFQATREAFVAFGAAELV